MKLNGFALIEMIVAITLITVTLVGFLFMLNGGFSNVFGSAHKSQATYASQDQMERAIAGNTQAPGTKFEEKTMTILFNDELSIQSQGHVIESTSTKNGKTSTMTTFVPD